MGRIDDIYNDSVDLGYRLERSGKDVNVIFSPVSFNKKIIKIPLVSNELIISTSEGIAG